MTEKGEMIDMEMKQSNSLESIVNKQVANWTVLFTKLHHYHWYVTGKDFFTLHDKFEELYNEGAVYLDELAERLLMLEMKPVGTLKEALEHASVKEAKGNEQADEMVRSIVHDFEMMVKELKEGINIAENMEDKITADMLLSIQQKIDKHIWMFKAFLNEMSAT